MALAIHGEPITLRVIGELAYIDYSRNKHNGPTLRLHIDLIRRGDKTTLNDLISLGNIIPSAYLQLMMGESLPIVAERLLQDMCIVYDIDIYEPVSDASL